VDHIAERIQHQRVLAERRKVWEAERKAEAEQREREAKQGRLRDYLGRRTEEWGGPHRLAAVGFDGLEIARGVRERGRS